MSNRVRSFYNLLCMINEKGHKLLEYLSGYVLGLAAFVILFQVFYRFVIVKIVSFSFPFTEEFARYLIIWSAYLIIGVCLSEGTHSTVDILYEKLPPKGRIIHYLVVRIIMIIFLVTVLSEAGDLLKMMARFKTPTMRMPSHILYFSVFFGCCSMLWEIAIEMFGVYLNGYEPNTKVGSIEEGML